MAIKYVYQGSGGAGPPLEHVQVVGSYEVAGTATNIRATHGAPGGGAHSGEIREVRPVVEEVRVVADKTPAANDWVPNWTSKLSMRNVLGINALIYAGLKMYDLYHKMQLASEVWDSWIQPHPDIDSLYVDMPVPAFIQLKDFYARYPHLDPYPPGMWDWRGPKAPQRHQVNNPGLEELVVTAPRTDPFSPGIRDVHIYPRIQPGRPVSPYDDGKGRITFDDYYMDANVWTRTAPAKSPETPPGKDPLQDPGKKPQRHPGITPIKDPNEWSPPQRQPGEVITPGRLPSNQPGLGDWVYPGGQPSNAPYEGYRPGFVPDTPDLPVSQIVIKPIMKPEPGISITVETGLRPSKKEENKQRKDKKKQIKKRMYRKFLKFFNNTFGRATEIADLAQAVQDNVYIPAGTVLIDKNGIAREVRKEVPMSRLSLDMQRQFIMMLATGEIDLRDVRIDEVGIITDWSMNQAADRFIGIQASHHTEALEGLGREGAGIKSNPIDFY